MKTLLIGVLVVLLCGVASANPTNVAIFRDMVPWNNDCDGIVLSNHGIPFTVFTRTDIGVVDLAPFDKVIISGGQFSAFNAAVQAHADWFDAFAAAGGCVLYSLATFANQIFPHEVGPGGFAMEHILNNAVTIEAPGHAIFTTPNDVTELNLNGWNYSSHGDLDLPSDALVLARNAGPSTGTCLAEVVVGSGLVMATMQPYQYAGAANPFSENMVLYVPDDPVATESKTWGTVKALFH